MSRQRRRTTNPGIYARTKNSGEVVYDVTYYESSADGSRKRFKSGFKTMKAAREWREETIRSIRRGLYVVPSDVTLGDYARRRLQRRYDIGQIARSSFRGDMRLLDTHLPDELSRLPIQHLTVEHLNELYQRLSTSGRKDGRPGGLSARTIERLNVLIGQTLKAAMNDGLVHRNVASATLRPRRVKETVRAMTAEEVRHLLDTARDDWFYALYFLAVTTGMRRSELCGLSWDNVYLAAGEIRIEKALVSVDHRPAWSRAKTHVSRRTLPLDPRSVEVLQEQRARVAAAKLLHGAGWLDEHNLVFPKPDGSLYNPEIIYMRLGRLLKKAGLGRYSFHALRHTYATLARRQGMDIKVLSDRLGHSTVTFTMDTYQHIPQDLAKQAANDVADFILGR